MSPKYVYFFGQGKAEGSAKMRDLLGGKGANLAEMTSIGIPVPPGFTISTEVCERYYENGKQYPPEVREQVEEALAKLEKAMGRKLGDPENPLFVSVRSGAAISMPGMMETILNLGMNDQTVEGFVRQTGNPRVAWDSYRRFIQMFGSVVKGIPHEEFEKILEGLKKERGVELDTDLTAEDLKELVSRYKELYKEKVGEEFPQDVKSQLWAAIDAVFDSWDNERARKYREINNIRGLKGTAVNVQAMVFGNFGDDSGTGVCFSRDPSTGENVFYGEFLMNAQGEDVVAGIRTPEKLSGLAEKMPEVYAQLEEVKNRLERHYRDMQDMEFTIEQGTLYLLQTRNGKRTGRAAVKIAVDMVKEGLISREEAVMRVSPEHIDQLLHPMLDPEAKKKARALAKGLNASPGAATGKIVFTARRAEELAGVEKVILVRKETSPEDIGGMHAAQGILTSTGGMTSHAAVVARGMGKPSVVGCKDVVILDEGRCKIGGREFKEGDWITIDGTTGEVFEGQIPLVVPEIRGELQEFLGWVDEIRLSAVRENCPEKGFRVRTNADTPQDARRAREFGAEGIGLCRTEHMFFDKGKIEAFREMIIADTPEARKKSLEKLLPLQKEDFVGIFQEMAGLPVTIRLLDPPLHEFVLMSETEIEELSRSAGVPAEKIRQRIEALHEMNPMLGHRGCRLGITYPEIYEMQARAVMLAACEVAKEGKQVYPEVMIPLVGMEKELVFLKERIVKVMEEVKSSSGVQVSYRVGTMIEVPRAALVAEKIASHAEFFSFGTNDLTQMTFGFSRDDVGSFLPAYLQMEILEADPFASLDEEGVGQLVKLAAEKGRKARPGIKLGICGEHGGDPASIDFAYRVGLDYVSCSPFRVPIARLAAAQAVIRNGK
ncbi:pyruvate, phosphate dikinase [Spirochaeta thermophila DSM 6578]|uniref:Pyruvate, phosphate dikinase n=1 Tax=Winmispira thermophila (strain ATCC 700085 / DSM 6578 / Z-1203) TaxID=869211 RepID=G0GEL0_WINT7|nr:pyruvate, phosphate dikinase [Spirochaeta thermophila]AEJ60698.1 pyruvate, phosphate dikinase [Spirochaeta thermophila DSM 6578]